LLILGSTSNRCICARILYWCVSLACCFGILGLHAQTNNEPGQQADSDSPPTMFPHSQTARYWVSGQDNIIFQYHPPFRAKYSGAHSFRDVGEHAASNIASLYTGYQLTNTTEIFMHFESAAGGGISDALGLGGFTDLDVVRNPTLGSTPYIARGMIRQIIPLSSQTVEHERDPWYLHTRVPVRRLEFRFGKMGLNDFFDMNDSGTDSHFQFTNWTVDNNGAYDYAADTRGYTAALIAEYHDRNWAFRFAEALMPKIANGLDYQWNLRRARAENIELELHPGILHGHSSALRLLSFVNHANMGLYRVAVANFLTGKTSRPDITAHPLQTTIKYGFGVNFEQDLAHDFRVFGRWGWNEGQHESFAYTEVDETIETGADLGGRSWRRPSDKIGLAFVSNGISADHQRYLALGGLGFLLGDGKLTYGRENIVESYYNAHVWRGIYAAVNLQHINDPGYNRDRGPVLVPGFRLHLEF
jgi:high affinity Mn2+ porin